MIDDEKLKKYRNKVIERTNHTDILVSSIIAKFYFKEPAVPINFVSNVLYQQPLSFTSRVNMLKNILKEKNMLDKKLINNLIKMSEIRNTFAHCEIKITFKGREEYIFNPKDYTKPVDFESLCTKFRKIDSETSPILISLFEKLIGKKLEIVRGEHH